MARHLASIKRRGCHSAHLSLQITYLRSLLNCSCPPLNTVLFSTYFGKYFYHLLLFHRSRCSCTNLYKRPTLVNLGPTSFHFRYIPFHVIYICSKSYNLRLITSYVMDQYKYNINTHTHSDIRFLQSHICHTLCPARRLLLVK